MNLLATTELDRLGDRVFRTIDGHDSGCTSYGVEAEDGRWFVKVATTVQAETSLRQAIRVHEVVRHPAVVPLRHHLTVGGHLALVHPWVAGEVLNETTTTYRPDRSDPAHPLARFRSLPVPVVTAAVTTVVEAHRAVQDAGLVAYDLYDGCLLWDGTSMHLVDLDEYRPGPFTVPGPALGSRRFMAPEELGSPVRVDIRTTVFTIGRVARLLLDAGDHEDAWRGTDAQADVVRRATRPDPDDRYPDVHALADAWQAAATMSKDLRSGRTPGHVNRDLQSPGSGITAHLP